MGVHGTHHYRLSGSWKVPVIPSLPSPQFSSCLPLTADAEDFVGVILYLALDLVQGIVKPLVTDGYGVAAGLCLPVVAAMLVILVLVFCI